MKITGLEIHPVVVSRIHHTAVGHGREMVIPEADAVPTISRFAVLELETDEGIGGLGEWSDIPDGRKMGEMHKRLEEKLVGRDPFAMEVILGGLDEDRSTRCAVDGALFDIKGKALEVPVYQLMGGRARERVEVSWVVYVRTQELIGEEIARMRQMGFGAFKLKVGSRIEHDDACVRIIRETAGPQAQIKLDASGVWEPGEAVENIRRLAQYGLQGVESPVRGRGAKDLAKVRQQVEVPIIEHVWDRWDYVMELVKCQSVDIVNLYPEGCGGLLRCKKVLAVVEAAGMQALLGSTVELGIGTAGQVHLGISSPGIAYPSDLIGPAMYRDDVIDEPFAYVDGGLLAPEGPGLGVELDRERLVRLRG